MVSHQGRFSPVWSFIRDSAVARMCITTGVTDSFPLGNQSQLSTGKSVSVFHWESSLSFPLGKQSIFHWESSLSFPQVKSSMTSKCIVKSQRKDHLSFSFNLHLAFLVITTHAHINMLLILLFFTPRPWGFIIQ